MCMHTYMYTIYVTTLCRASSLPNNIEEALIAPKNWAEVHSLPKPMGERKSFLASSFGLYEQVCTFHSLAVLEQSSGLPGSQALMAVIIHDFGRSQKVATELDVWCRWVSCYPGRRVEGPILAPIIAVHDIQGSVNLCSKPKCHGSLLGS